MIYKILIADADLNVHIIIKNASLEQFWNVKICSVYNGREAFNTAYKENVDLIILSWNLSRMSGLEVLQKLKQNISTNDIPVIMMGSKSNVEAAFNAGASDFLVKPINKLDLFIRLKSMFATLKLIKNIEGKTAKIRHRNKILNDERIKTDALLTNILPKEIAEQLKTKGQVAAKNFRMASVLFTDFEGFTKISEQLQPQEIVKELGIFFAKFDQIVGEHFIEKIKTIGDAYMCAGGLPLRNQSNPIDTVLAGLEMQHFATTVNERKRKKGELEWNLRIGIHTGRVIAGVVGTRKFAYDIWGDTVNMASRMESSGEIGKVNISGATYKHIKDYFECEYRGKIRVKHKGNIDMYFVHGLKPEYSVKNSNIIPNKEFLTVLAKY